MTAMALTRPRTRERLFEPGTIPGPSRPKPIHSSLDSTWSALDLTHLEEETGKPDVATVLEQALSAAVSIDASHFDQIVELSRYLVEANGTVAEQGKAALLHAARASTGTVNDEMTEEMLPRVSYGREEIDVEVVYVAPRFSWTIRPETDTLLEVD